MKEKIVDAVKEYVWSCEENQFPETGGRYFDKPLIRVASGKDPLFERYKTLIGDMHKTPKEAYESTYGDENFEDGSVISVVLPIAESIRGSNRPQKDWPSREWALARTRFDGVYAGVSRFMENLLERAGRRGVTPRLSSWYKIVRVRNGFASLWSDRHAAYAAGHGTFSLNDGFITEKGIAVRFISVVTDMKLEPDARTASAYNSNCLHYSKAACGACIKKCPVGALTESGHDKFKCYQRCYGEESQKLAVFYGGSAEAGAGCGLCQVGVPCESKNPMS